MAKINYQFFAFLKKKTALILFSQLLSKKLTLLSFWQLPNYTLPVIKQDGGS